MTERFCLVAVVLLVLMLSALLLCLRELYLLRTWRDHLFSRPLGWSDPSKTRRYIP